MDSRIEKDLKCKKVLYWIIGLYIATAIVLMIEGALRKSSYEFFLAMSTLAAIPGLYIFRRIFHLQGGYQLEIFIVLFSWLGWSLGGAAEFYGKIPYYDKAVHCLSGTFVAVLAMALYHFLERGHSKDGENPATGCLFVFFGSMAVAGLFELCEFTLAPIMNRDLQHVIDTGVGDTMWDMIVCLLGTLPAIGLMLRRTRGKHDFLTDAAETFALQNPRRTAESSRK